MKFLLLLFLPVSVFCQSHKSTATKKVKDESPCLAADSSWIQIQADSTFGKIAIKLSDGGVIKGDGVVIHETRWQMRGWKKNPNYKTDTARVSMFDLKISSGCSVFASQDYERTWGYIKTKNGYKHVEGEYQFIPE
ncbi:MAG: hypothetical protein C5B59_14500 [Bacteroidetes bacterium]|nr:MAG: hypothetical protein C5B59_14500 [Bacteroidota bacterium]